MTARADLARRLAFGLCGLAVGLRLNAALAQTPVARCLRRRSASVAPAVTPAVAWSAANLPEQPVYQDHYIGGGSLAPDISAGETAPAAATARVSRARCRSTPW